MEEKGLSNSCVFVSEARDDSLYAMYFGISCAFFALKNLSNQVVDNQKCLETRDKMLQWSANLLGLLVCKRVQREEEKSIEKYELLHKLEAAEREIMELRRTRSEDAKANEKVASIYAAQEQSWFAERRKLRYQIAGLLNDLRILDKRKNEAISELHRKVAEMEVLVKSKEKVSEEEERKRKEMEEKVKSSEGMIKDLREKSKREAQDHSSELLKHKTAFIELVSNQRQIEAELGRTLRQVEAAKQQIEFLFEEKEEALLMVEESSVEIEKMRKESEHKDKILSTVIREIKLDSPEKQIILKDQGKLFNPRKIDVAERKTERLGSFPSSRSDRKTLRNFLTRQVSSRLLEVFPEVEAEGNTIPQEGVAVFGAGMNARVRKGNGDHSLLSEQGSSEDCTEIHEATRLDEWVHAEAEKYHNAVEQRHQLELNSLEDQIRMKDDKLEACRWQVLSAEVESKRLLSKIEGLNQEVSLLRDNNSRLETLLVDRDLELKTLKDHIAIQLNNLSSHQKSKRHSSRRESLLDDHETGRSKVKFVKKKPAGNSLVLAEEVVKKEEERESLSKHNSSTSFSSIENVEEKNGVESKINLNKINTSSWKVDLHALGITYKIKRLNQQFLMLDRLITGKQESDDLKGFAALISLLKKQLSRYQSLQEKTDDLSKRMGEKDVNLKRGVPSSKKTKEETRKLEHFLEETFQLQRYIVATGQKLMEVQSKIVSGFVTGIANELDGPANFDMKRFGDTIQTLYQDVQRGLEVRISRIIGDLEGTLAYEGIHFLK